MNKKQLEIKLSKLTPLSSLNVNLEQYQLEGTLAAELLWNAFSRGDIEGKTVIDFGCGNGILGVGALLLGAKKVLFLDIDEKALAVSKKNSEGKGIYLHLDISLFKEKVDTVLMNPPFGVQKRKADKVFLEQAMKFSDVIYSIHKIESKTFIQKLATEHHFFVQEILERDFLIKKTYSFHKKKTYPVPIGIWSIRKA